MFRHMLSWQSPADLTTEAVLRQARLALLLHLVVPVAVFGFPVEMLKNAGFEAAGTSPVSWRSARWSGKAKTGVDRHVARSGRQSLMLSGFSDEDTAVASQVARLPSRKGKTVTLTGWWRGERLTGTGGRVVVRTLDAKGKPVADFGGLTVNGTFDWKPFSRTIPLPPQAAALQVFLEIWDSSGTVWFDDVSLTLDLAIDEIKGLSREELPEQACAVSPVALTITESDQSTRFTLMKLDRRGPLAASDVPVVLLDAQDKVAARHTFSLPASATGLSSAEWTVDVASLPDGLYRLVLAEGTAAALGYLDLSLHWERLADKLGRADFNWKSLNCHGPARLKSVQDCRDLVRRTKAMGFDCLLFNAKTPGGQLFYRSKIGRPEPVTEQFDPLQVVAQACKEAGLQVLVQFCTFAEGRKTIWLEEHPEWVEVDQGEPADYRQQRSIFGCPDRPEVRAYELSLIREILTNYPVDGISFDYIRYKNDYACFCAYSEQTLQEYMARHHLAEKAARERRARETIVGFTQAVRQAADEIRPGLLLHGYTHPEWANEFPLNYHSRRASAHGKDPRRGGQWSLERVYQAAKRNVETARAVLDYPIAAPMADTAYTNWAKSPERFRRELRLIRHAGAQAVMVYPYSTLRAKPLLRRMLAEELGGNPEEAAQ